MTAAEAAKLLDGMINAADIAATLKPKLGLGQNLRDVVLRLSRSLEAQKAVEDYISQAWSEWAEKERPRRETIDIYDRLFSLQR